MLGYSNDLKDPAAVDDSAALPGDDVEATLIVEQVAHVTGRYPAIGGAGVRWRAADGTATIAGNRITVNYDVFAQFIAAVYGPVRSCRRQLGDLCGCRDATGLDLGAEPVLTTPAAARPKPSP